MDMIVGGPGAFIGGVYRIAACLDGEIELVCGAFSSDARQSLEMGAKLGLSADRIYGSYKEMIEHEHETGEMDFVVIVTPNHVHYEPAILALLAGFDVILDKPMCHSLEQARHLSRTVDETGRTLCLTHAYTGYPMVKQPRQMILRFDIGLVRKVYVEYQQGWLSHDNVNSKQTQWRLDPKQSGPSGCLGDIGVHAFNLAEYVTGLQITHVCTDLRSVIDGRQLDDDVSVLLRFNNGASGVLMASQAMHNARIPAGHPEGYIEAFANIYRNFARTVRAKKNDEECSSNELGDFSGVKEGVRGMTFIETCVANSRKDNEKWTALKE
ncbi:unnamed protein product [Rotaria magnacalcarata]|uniref:Oxidoreductase n=2 Tax=Rotaria magnacalcarata TaxID=392030 RepID=A0A816PRM7_9BILA|nr:unnamed protein product [Rotaria magnacalcarata]CAF2050999.1 unnamed protein product [Rotaria magnacalcarata]